jgi:hypothetical protein
VEYVESHLIILVAGDLDLDSKSEVSFIIFLLLWFLHIHTTIITCNCRVLLLSTYARNSTFVTV